MSPYDLLGKRPYLILESEDTAALAMFAYLASQNPNIWVRSKPAGINPEEKRKDSEQ